MILASKVSLALSSTVELKSSVLDLSNDRVAVGAKSDLAPSATLSFDRSKTEDLSSTFDERDRDTLKATVSWPFFSGGKNIASLKKNKSSEIRKNLLLDF